MAILDVLSGTSPQVWGEPAPVVDELSEAELRVVRYLPSNLRAPEIAGELFVSTNTIRTHLRHIYSKLDATAAPKRSPARGSSGCWHVKGRFERHDGTLDLRREPAIELTINAASLNTGNSTRDKHLRSSDFFGVENHPQVRFVSERAELDGERLKVSGRLYAAGTSTPLELDAALWEDGDELEVDARTYTDHRRLGMSSGMLGMIRSASELIVHGRLVRDPG